MNVADSITKEKFDSSLVDSYFFHLFSVLVYVVLKFETVFRWRICYICYQ